MNIVISFMRTFYIALPFYLCVILNLNRDMLNTVFFTDNSRLFERFLRESLKI